ncbi:hypothetical protein ANTRET_LOCUS10043 [Anthophora retusa]
MPGWSLTHEGGLTCADYTRTTSFAAYEDSAKKRRSQLVGFAEWFLAERRNDRDEGRECSRRRCCECMEKMHVYLYVCVTFICIYVYIHVHITTYERTGSLATRNSVYRRKQATGETKKKTEERGFRAAVEGKRKRAKRVERGGGGGGGGGNGMRGEGGKEHLSVLSGKHRGE